MGLRPRARGAPLILNISVTLGKYPSKLKLSKIPPIFKSGEDNDAKNYRPVSLLSNFNRIFEKDHERLY